MRPLCLFACVFYGFLTVRVVLHVPNRSILHSRLLEFRQGRQANWIPHPSQTPVVMPFCRMKGYPFTWNLQILTCVNDVEAKNSTFNLTDICPR